MTQRIADKRRQATFKQKGRVAPYTIFFSALLLLLSACSSTESPFNMGSSEVASLVTADRSGLQVAARGIDERDDESFEEADSFDDDETVETAASFVDFPSPERSNPFIWDDSYSAGEHSALDTGKTAVIRVLGFVETDQQRVLISVNGSSVVLSENEPFGKLLVGKISPPTVQITLADVTRTYSLLDRPAKTE